MALQMANGEGNSAAWRVQDGSDLPKVDHDQKTSGFEAMLHLEGIDDNHYNTTRDEKGVSIVNQPDADRPLVANFLVGIPSSENFGTIPTDEISTDVTQNSRSRVDTTSSFGSSSSSHHHSHHPLYQSQQQHPEQHLFDNYISSSFSATSDPHLDLSTLTTSSAFIPNQFSPIGNRDTEWTARLGSGIPSTDTHTLSPETQNQQVILSSTPLQSNLSIKQNDNTTISSLQQLQQPSIAEQTAGASEKQTSSSMGHGSITDTPWALEDNKMDRVTPEGKNRDGDDSTVQSTAVLSTGTHDGDADPFSPASSPRVVPSAAPSHDSEDDPSRIIGTPSTISTAPSTEDASLGTDSLDKIGLKLDPTHIEPFTLHRRAPSWDRSPNQRNLYSDTEFTANLQPAAQKRQQLNAESPQYWLPQHLGPSPAQAYAHHQQQQQQQHAAASSPRGNIHNTTQPRVASFRPEEHSKHDSRGGNFSYGHVPPQHGPPPVGGGDRWHPHYSQQVRAGHHMQQAEGMGTHGYRSNQGYNPYSVQRKPGYPPHHPLPSSQSPSRATRTPRSQAGPSPHRTPQQSGGPPNPASTGGGSRSSSEILKTLLRKKACLYEPDTSRAVALVTWLVGRELALEYGYFSRQQLQAGVHACVADKIESGTITRTKVNRCMQIILNSCFHYIIPRPDGTEEKGHVFRATFEQEVSDDTLLLRLLPAPWNDLVVNRATVLRASLVELEGKSEPRSNQASPKGSPALKPAEHRSPSRERGGGEGDGDSKRAVLLCFNENVRAAEDVFRCHNEFIRDSAHSSNLQLTAQEWRIFFGKEAASTPHIWGNVGIPVVTVDSPNGTARKVDVLGQMTPDEAGKFRSTWCAKRYDHDHEFCGMAHVEVNGGWLRRNPNVHQYRDELCPSINKVADKRLSQNVYVINECPKGIKCEYAHSHEEVIYHPNRYKARVCGSIMRSGVCRFGDICPNHHPSDSSRPAGGKKGDGRPPSSRHSRSSAQSGPGGKGSVMPPSGAPILYASPAPVSSFERHLLMPGLQNLFRRQCTVVRSYLRNPKCRCCYSYFGDDTGIDVESAARPAKRPGLPPSSLRT